jgi:hypothetical protein
VIKGVYQLGFILTVVFGVHAVFFAFSALAMYACWILGSIPEFGADIWQTLAAFSGKSLAAGVACYGARTLVWMIAGGSVRADELLF